MKTSNDMAKDGYRFVTNFGNYGSVADQIRALQFRAGMVLWYNALKGKEILRFTASPVSGKVCPEDSAYWFKCDERFNLSDFWNEYDKERVRRNIWYPFEREDDRRFKRNWLAAVDNKEFNGPWYKFKEETY